MATASVTSMTFLCVDGVHPLLKVVLFPYIPQQTPSGGPQPTCPFTVIWLRSPLVSVLSENSLIPLGPWRAATPSLGCGAG